MNPPLQFERSSPRMVGTDKDLLIKDLFTVTESETSIWQGQRFKRTEVRGAVTTVSTSDYLIAVTALAVATSIGLPDPRLVGAGKTFKVKDEVGGAATTTVTIRSENERTIDGASTSTLTTNYQVRSFYSNGDNWFTH